LYAGRNSTAPPRRVSTRYLRFNGKYRRGQGRAIPSRRRSRSEHLQRLIQGELRHLIKIACLLAGGGAAGRRGPFDTLQTLARVDEGRPLTGHRLLHGLVEIPASLPELIARLLYLPEIQLVDLGDGALTPPPHEVCEFVGCEGGQGHDRTLVRRSRGDDRSGNTQTGGDEQ